MQVPTQLNYNQLQTKAFFSVFKQWPIQPIANGGQYWPGQVVRIFLNALTEGVMDPFRSHIQITVSCDPTTLPVGLLQVDNSAQSFIQQIVLSSKNRQVQRIVEYGVLAAYLTDIGYSQLYTEGKQVQGLGHNTMDNYSSIFNSSFSAGSAGMFYDPDVNIYRTFSSNGTIHPTIPQRYQNMVSQGSQNYLNTILPGVFRNHVTPLNQCWLDSDQAWFWFIYANGDPTMQPYTGKTREAGQSLYGYNHNVRAEYLTANLSKQYADTNTTLSKYELRVNPAVMGGMFPGKFQNGVVYNVYIPETVPIYHNDVNSGIHAYTAGNTPNLFGYTTLLSPNFCKGVHQPFISPTVPQAQMINGVMNSQKIPVIMRTFKIPLLSSVLGLLIPQDQFVLLPLRCLNDILIELTLDNYAMFTSGYNDIGQFDNVGMGLMQKRAYSVDRIVYNLHTYQFWNPQMDQYLKVSMTTGIAINTRFWQLGNQYQIQNAQSITNSWPVACNQEALNSIIILFVPLDYQNFTFCRKHFRLSNNISKLQLRINMQYFPSQPITGNAGNPIQIDATGNNSVFMEQLYMANGYLFEKRIPAPRINPFNFAINERCYDIQNTHTFYDPAMIDNENYTWSPLSINSQTAMGMANIHQNRYVGKAAYLFSFEPYAHSKNFLTGIDTRAAKSFDVIFTSIPQNWFPRPQTMYIYTCSSVIMEYSSSGIVNINK